MSNYQIRKLSNPVYYSQGAIYRWSDTHKVNWTFKKGKIWKTEKAVKAHLLKYLTLVGSVDDLEIIEIVEIPTKPAHDWIDAKMLTKVLKNK